MFKIEKGIPYEKKSKYPFKEMSIGDSFLAPSKLRAPAYKTAKKMGVKIKTTKVDDLNMRVWRVA